MSGKLNNDRQKGLRVVAIGLSMLAIAVVWPSLMVDQRSGLLVTLLSVSLGLVLFGAIATLSTDPSGSESSSQARRVVQAAVPVVAVAVSAMLATALFWISTARIELLG